VISDPTNAAELRALALAVRREVDALVSTLAEAMDVQWMPSPIPRPRDDTTERAKGGHGDPTPSITLDDRRLDVRAQVRASARRLGEAAEAARVTRAALEAALDAWAGHHEE
jgi:hypothetical protein